MLGSHAVASSVVKCEAIAVVIIKPSLGSEHAA